MKKNKQNNIGRVGKKAAMSAFFFAAAMGLAWGQADYADAQLYNQAGLAGTGNANYDADSNSGAGAGGYGGGGGEGGNGGAGDSSSGAPGDGGEGGKLGGTAGSGPASGAGGTATSGLGKPGDAGAGGAGLGGAGGTGGSNGGASGGDVTVTPAGAAEVTDTITGTDPVNSLTYIAGSGGGGGGGGRGGDGGAGGHSTGGLGWATPGHNGGDGGKGGTGGAGAKITINLGTLANDYLDVNGAVALTSGVGGDGGNGGAGGTAGAPNDGGGSNGGRGGNGGEGGEGGTINLNLHSQTTYFHDDASFIANKGGAAGANGALNGATGVSTGGNGGKAGDIILNNPTKDVIFGQDVTARAGDGGNGATGGNTSRGGDGGKVNITVNTITLEKDAAALNQTFTVRSGDGGTGVVANTGYGGVGGEVKILTGDLKVLENNATLAFHKGGASVTDGSLGGKVDFLVSHIFTVEEDIKLDMTFDGAAMTTTDQVHLDTLELKAGSTLDAFTNSTTKGTVAAGETSIGAGGVNYTIDNLIVRNNADWLTNGTYAPTTGNGVSGQRVTFDMTGVKRLDHDGVVMLEMYDTVASGQIGLTNFDPVLQQYAYNNSITKDNTAQFITSDYELKRYHLGTITLVDSTDGITAGTNGARPGGAGWNAGNNIFDANKHLTDQDKVNWFATDAGLRRYFWDVYLDDGVAGNPLKANNFKTADGYKTFLQGYLAGTSSLNQTFWNTTEPAMREAAAAPLDTTVLTVKMGGSSIETNTGSHIDVDSYGVSLALSRRFESCWNDSSIGVTTLGLFMEYGDGAYDTYANITDLGSLYGDGDVRHVGGGIFARHDFNQGTYFEGSVRGGSLDNDYKLKKDTRFNAPYNHKWNTSGSYFGAHLGLGHQFDLTEQTMLDVYGKLLWTRTSGETAETHFEKFHADSVDSIRHRIGARLNHTSDSGLFKGFAGLAWEHEYDGEATGYVSGAAVPKDRIRNAPDLGGSSGIAEVGFSYRPDQAAMYTIDFSAFGIAGEQEGFGGTLGLKFEF